MARNREPARRSKREPVDCLKWTPKSPGWVAGFVLPWPTGVRANAGRSDGSRAGRTGALDALSDEHVVRSNERDGTTSKSQRRYIEKHGSAADDHSGSDARNSRSVGADSQQIPATAIRPISSIARNRHPVRGSRQRISRLAESLLARIDLQPKYATDNFDRHRPAGKRNYREMAAVPATQHERER